MPGQPQIPNSTMLQQSQQQQNSSDMNYATADEQPNLNSNSYNNSHNVSVSQAEYGGN